MAILDETTIPATLIVEKVEELAIWTKSKELMRAHYQQGMAREECDRDYEIFLEKLFGSHICNKIKQPGFAYVTKCRGVL